MLMKKGIIAIGLLLSLQQIQAQTKVGIHGGTDLNNIHISGIPDMLTDGKQLSTSGSIGLHAEQTLLNQLSVRSELNFVKKGFSLDQHMNPEIGGITVPLGVKANTSLSYIEIPLLLAYSMPVGNINLIGEAGPVLSYGLKGRIQPVATVGLDFNLPDININFSDDGYQRFNHGATVGIGVESNLSDDVSLFAKTRYTHSFSDILQNPIIDIKTRANTLHFGIGMNYKI